MLKKISYSENLITLDYKTSTAEQYDLSGKATLWIWATYSVLNNELKDKGTTIESLFESLDSQASKTIICYNAQMFLRFANYYLRDNGFTFMNNSNIKTSEMPNKSCNIIISAAGMLTQCIIKIKGRNVINLLDAKLKLGQPLKDLSDAYDLGYTVQKITKEPTKEREIATEEDFEKLVNNLKILTDALRIVLSEGCFSISQSGDARSKFLKYYKFSKPDNHLTPKLEKFEDYIMRKGYTGGHIIINPKYQGKDLTDVSSYDVNSMYGYIMRNKLLPLGKPVKFNGEYQYDKDYPLYMQVIEVCCKIKPNHLPTILVHTKKNMAYDVRDTKNAYLTTTGQKTMELILTSIDLEMLKQQYDIRYINYIGGYKFKASEWMFRSYIDQLYDKKKNAHNKAERQHAKNMLNALSGKFGQDFRFYNKSITTNPKTGLLDYSNYVVNESDNVGYVPLGAYINSYGRQILLNAAQANYDNLVYADTDSIHIIGTNPKGIKIDNYELGAWKCEGHYKKARYLEKKVYITVDDNDLTTVKCSGVEKEFTADRNVINFDTFKLGATIPNGKKITKEVEGGCIVRYSDTIIG